MTTFENPANRYREEVTAAAILWSLLFGWIYFAVRGLWAHVVIQFAVTIGLGLLTGGSGALIGVPLWLGYAFASPALLRTKYRRAGWRQVD